ncbi:uncharacterized protein LOC144655845 isoform X2 [Oculina patagonica]
MDNKQEVLQAIGICTLIATFLFNTSRVLKAIELCMECLILLNKKAIEDERKLLKGCWKRIYRILGVAYVLVNDYASSIHYNSKLLAIHREYGEKDEEGFLSLMLAKLYQRQSKYAQAKDLYEKAINIIIETGDRENEALAYQNLGTVFHSLGEHVKAKELLEKAIVINVETGDRNGEGSTYADLANVFEYIGEYDKAERYLTKALDITKELGDRQGEASCFGNLGNLLHLRGENVKAKEYLKTALVIMLKIGDKRGQAAAYANLGNVFKSLGEYVKAKKCLEKSLPIIKEFSDKEEVAAIYLSLGNVCESLAKYATAKEYYEKTLRISKEIGHRRSEAASYVNLANVFKSLGEYLKAKEFYEKALAIRVKAGERKGEAVCYIGLGSVFQSLGEYFKAKEYFEKALVITTAIGDKQGEGTVYGGLANVCQALGELVQAKEFLEKALAISIEIGDIKGEVTCHANLGYVFRLLGDYSKARELFEKALEITKEIGDRNGEGAAYGNLGVVFAHLGEYVKAKEHFENALAIRREIGDKKGEAFDYGNLGALFQSLQEFVTATGYLEKALVINKEIGDKYGEGVTYGNLATLFQSLGEYAKAEEYLAKSLAIRVEIDDILGEAQVYENLGGLFISLHEYANAKQYLKKALAISVQIGNRQLEAACVHSLGIVFERGGEYVKADEYYGRALKISKGTGDIAVELRCHCSLMWVKCLEGNGQDAFDSLVASVHSCEKLRVFLKDNDKFQISLLDRNAPHYLLLSSLFRITGDPNKALYSLELGRARALSDLMSNQYSVENQFSANPQSWVGIENIMKKEKHCTCLYISCDFHDISLWVLKTNGVIEFRTNIAADESSTCNQPKELFRRFCTSTKKHFEDRSLVSLKIKQPRDSSFQHDSLLGFRLVEEDLENQDQEPSLAEYYKMIIAPVADLLKEPEIIIVSDNILYQVPFAALQDASGRYLSETFIIRIVPSLMTLKLIQDSPQDYHSQTGALIVGDPEVGRVLYKGRLENISRLPCAGKEAEMIGRVLGVNPLLGEHATKKAVLQRINSVSLIHFAAHGDAERGEIAFAPLRNTQVTPEEEDYLLTMTEISQVQLRAKLVVLSCCHSGQGDIKVEGVVGIARAFLGSGARSVLVALWAIEDSATEQFMGRFYEHLVGGESASECLHEAMKWMRANGYSDVRQWAPFMLIGDNVTFNFGNKGASSTA